MSDNIYSNFPRYNPTPSDQDLSIGKIFKPYYNLNSTVTLGELNLNVFEPQAERLERQPSSQVIPSLQSLDGPTVWVEELMGSSESNNFFAPLESGAIPCILGRFGGQMPASVDSEDAVYGERYTQEKVPNANGSKSSLGNFEKSEYVLFVNSCVKFYMNISL